MQIVWYSIVWNDRNNLCISQCQCCQLLSFWRFHSTEALAHRLWNLNTFYWFHSISSSPRSTQIEKNRGLKRHTILDKSKYVFCISNLQNILRSWSRNPQWSFQLILVSVSCISNAINSKLPSFRIGSLVGASVRTWGGSVHFFVIIHVVYGPYEG